MIPSTLVTFAALAVALGGSEPEKFDTTDAALFRIMCVESSGKKIDLHPDKTSYGYFGLTKVACKQVGESWPPSSPAKEYRAARKYFSYCLDIANGVAARKGETEGSDKAFSEACGIYHGGNAQRRLGYRLRCRGVRLPEEWPEALAVFREMKK